MRGSILPPHRIKPTLRPAKRSGDCQHGGKSGGAGAFGHHLLQGQERIDRALDHRLVDQNNVATNSRTTGSVSVPTFFTAMPSASVAPPHGKLPRWIAFHIDG